MTVDEKTKFSKVEINMLRNSMAYNICQAIELMEVNEDDYYPCLSYCYFDVLSFEHRCVFLYMFTIKHFSDRCTTGIGDLFSNFEIIEDMIFKGLLVDLKRRMEEEGCPYSIRDFFEYLAEERKHYEERFEDGFELGKKIPSVLKECKRVIDSENFCQVKLDSEYWTEADLLFEGILEDDYFFNPDVDDIHFFSADANLSNISLLGIEEDYFNPSLPKYTREEAMSALRATERMLRDKE